jgi:hypothetical protein
MAVFEWLLSRLPGPSRGPRAVELVTVIARHLDDAITQAKVAAKIDLPSEAPDDALPSIGRDRVIERVPLESLDAYRARLTAAWEAWSWACTTRGVMTPILLAGLGAPTILTQRELPRPPNATWFARFTVLFTGRVVWDGTFTWDDSFTWDAHAVAPIETMDVDAARASLRRLIGPWKSARDRVTSAIIARGAWLWDAGDTWDSPRTIWDAAVVTEIAAPLWDSTPMRWDDGTWCWDYLL